MALKEIHVPDIGDFSDVPVIELHVKPGDAVAVDDPIATLESDKATMDVPAPEAGVVKDVKVAVGDKVSEGALLITIEAAGEAAEGVASRPSADSVAGGARAEGDIHADLVVLGAGPGGYSAAFRAADLGQKVVLIERWPTLGGVCLNVGCIPSKALLHAAKVMSEAEEMGAHGISFAKPEVDIDKLRSWKDGVVGKLTGGLNGLAKGRKVTVVRGVGAFSGRNMITVSGEEGEKTVTFEKCVIAAGSEPVHLPFMPWDDPRVVDSTGALELRSVPKRMLVVGGGIIGLEMATVYAALGAQITVVELMSGLMAGADPDVVKPWQKRMAPKFENIFLETKVTGAEATDAGVKVMFEGAKAPAEDVFDLVLVSVGRVPNGGKINAEAAGVDVDERGFIAVDKQMRTNVPHIFAIGDIVGQPMLAHKAVHEGKTAAEVAAGHKSAFDAKVIPSVAYTDPEVAWVGLTETEAKAKDVKIAKGVFPWAASGRALANDRSEGFTKVIFDPETKRILGCAIVGPSAGDLIAEAALAIEMGADAEDIELTIHPHPTLSETVAMAAEMFTGHITDLMPPKK
ncbi:MAG: dihydrolipoyl dehydrogenase [Neomegalonema sp.]|nr:dihydrolipoyl dehydrogenase [Neomegalonema sp.]